MKIKTILMTIVLPIMVGINVQLNAQITLDTIVSPTFSRGYDFKTVQISRNETKYFFADTLNNSFSLYNMDFTPFLMDISVPEPYSNFTFQVLYVTRELFDCDSTNIEYAYYAPTDLNKPFRIMRTDGTVLLQVDSANGPFCIGSCLGLTDVLVPIRNTSSGAKLFLQRANPYQQIYIYSLCGELPVDIFDLAQSRQPVINLFPNPAVGLITFQINLLDNMQEYDLVILDVNAREVKRIRVSALKSAYYIDLENFNSGSYFYSLRSKDKIHKSGTFILNK